MIGFIMIGAAVLGIVAWIIIFCCCFKRVEVSDTQCLKTEIALLKAQKEALLAENVRLINEIEARDWVIEKQGNDLTISHQFRQQSEGKTKRQHYPNAVEVNNG